jgi:hypothetical protein
MFEFFLIIFSMNCAVSAFNSFFGSPLLDFNQLFTDACPHSEGISTERLNAAINEFGFFLKRLFALINNRMEIPPKKKGKSPLQTLIDRCCSGECFYVVTTTKNRSKAHGFILARCKIYDVSKLNGSHAQQCMNSKHVFWLENMNKIERVLEIKSRNN